MGSITIGGRDQLTSRMLTMMHNFRYEIFVRRLGWALPLAEGVERDQYDHEKSTYLVLSNESDEVTACARLLPTTEDYMLPALFPQLLGGRPAPRNSAVWELSRFACGARAGQDGRVVSLARPSIDLLEAVFSYVRGKGVRQLVLVTSIPIERLLLREGFEVSRAGAPCEINGSMTVALFISVPERDRSERLN